MPRECLSGAFKGWQTALESNVALGKRYCLHGSAFRARKRWLLSAGKRPWKAFKGKRLRPGKWQAWTPITGG